MNTWLYLTAEGLVAESTDWPCCVWSPTGQPQTLPLDQAAEALNGHAVDLLLPIELCSWVRSDPWPSRRAPDKRVIAFAVEDQLSEALETLHLSVGTRDREGRYPVMVIARQRLTDILALLAASGIEVRSIFVDADVLPDDRAQGVWWSGRWILGGGLPARMALSEDGLTQLRPVLPADIQWCDERQDGHPLDQWLMTRPAHAINLLQGSFAPRRRPLPWRFGGFAMAIVLLMTWGASEMRIRFLDSETRRLVTQNEQRFKAIYPDQNRIVDLAAQLKALQSRPVESQNTRIAGLVKLIDQVIGASAVEVRRIEFRAGDGWKIQLTANSFAELEQLRERGRQQGMSVRLDSATKERDNVHATLTVGDNA
jgi:general secretion pathway protein L